ncbi:hypothetical protein ACS0TY_006998 [Phlomoides rotata]
MASASASTPYEIAAEGPVLNLINKRLRALRKKLNRITQMEESVVQGNQASGDGNGSPKDQNGRLNRKVKDEEDISEDNGNESEDPSSQKKPRVVWSIELHRKFVAVVNQLGIDRALPKRILDLQSHPCSGPNASSSSNCQSKPESVSRDRETSRRKLSPEKRTSDKSKKPEHGGVDFSKLFHGYDNMLGWNRGGGHVNRGGVAGNGERQRALGAAAGRELLEEGAVRLVPHHGKFPPESLTAAAIRNSLSHLLVDWFILFDIEFSLAAKFRNSGQTCVCANRILVQEAIYDKFAKAFSKVVESMEVGNGFGEGVVRIYLMVIIKQAGLKLQENVLILTLNLSFSFCVS